MFRRFGFAIKKRKGGNIMKWIGMVTTYSRDEALKFAEKFKDDIKGAVLKVGATDFLSEDLNNIVERFRESGINFLMIVIKLTKGFDEYDIEKYVEKLSLIKPAMFWIEQATGIERPSYKALKEVQGALEHFAKLESVNKSEGYQIFDFEGINIRYDYIPD